MKTFTAKDVSVVFQGGLSTDLGQIGLGMRSARLAFPGAEIIVSAFEASVDQEVQLVALGADQVVFSRDPGPLRTDLSLRPDNTNRMIVSSREGLRRSTRPISLKLRSDAIVLHDDVLSRWDKMRAFDQASGRPNGIFRDRLIASSVFSRRFYATGLRAPYHVSDWQFFGWTDDIATYFDVELGNEEGWSRYFPQGLGDPVQGDLTNLKIRTFRMAPEEYVLAQTAARHGAPAYRDLLSAGEDVVAFADDFVRDNFVFLDPFTYGALVPKYLASCLNVAGAIDLNDYGWNDPMVHLPAQRERMRPWPGMSFTQMLTRAMGPIRRWYCLEPRPKALSVAKLAYAVTRRVCILFLGLRFGPKIKQTLRR